MEILQDLPNKLLNGFKAVLDMKCEDYVDLYHTSKAHIYNMIHPFVHQYETKYQNLVNQYHLDTFDQVVLSLFAVLVLYKIVKSIQRFVEFIFSDKERSFKAYIFYLLVTYLPFAKKKLEADLAKVETQFYEACCKNTEKRCPKLPAKGMKSSTLQKRIQEWVQRDEQISGTGKISGSRYCDDTEYENEIKNFTKDFLYHNPLHYEIFPATRQMEAEIIKMTCNMFGSDDGYGYTTSGGTESILMAVLAHRNYAAKFRNVTEPNLVMSRTAHPAFNKACKYFKIKCIRVGTNDKAEVDLKQLESRIDSNTIMIVGSVPSYPYGVIDDIPALAKIAKAHKIGLHVDCCLGGFVVAFAKDYGLQIKPFDFTVDGVTSISCDHHKYALAPKGISVVMFKTKELRHQTYTSVSDWPGGFYATPSVCGSKPGAPIAGAWYAMMYHGREGYVEKSKAISTATQAIVKAIRELPELQELDVIGNPCTCSLAIIYKKETKRNIYHLEGALSKLGWKFSGIQLPPAIQISMNHGIANRTKELIKDLKNCVKDVAENPEKYKDSSSASMYGASVKVPDIKTLDRVLDAVVDSFLKL
ncbi:pyridoxal-dependent decarboxylase domain protein (macronuclear) [Tetrahymena thermophila SB210]|uniref:sphinganine-1-phosphate aldolase n=1 Tax=Tetrahymena thermophila (strain SB210) TaxID=312017 RepID=Q23K59_TETTS|nr:pyridoxal-dependent decarboxylase domain protein [Tetrahymena thermophila SB210]EAR96984.2 pyridoxal-dependent decarboxylase domain protein [Tetrahymena thermophila SB210]|eukprot:XP_001017229.2 pyridoxal-dependent decarboxylase domain protein [Tetrahymena thermophila SB210]